MTEQDIKQDQPAQLSEDQLDDVQGGLPAVQKVREAAARISSSQTSTNGTATIASGD